MLAVAAGILLWVLSGSSPSSTFVGREMFECVEEDPSPEDTSDIDGLKAKMYVSVFGPQPVEEGIKWGKFHITKRSPDAGNTQNMDDIAVNGLNLHNRILEGPPVDDLGLSVTDKFTWIIAARFNAFEEFETTDLDTETLLQMQTSSIGSDFIAELNMTPDKEKVEGTTATRVGFSLAAGKSNGTSPDTQKPVFDPEQPYMIVVNRNVGQIEVRRYPLMVTNSSGILAGAQEILKTSVSEQGLTPSNQPVLFNRTGRLDMSAYAIALFDSSLTSTQELKLQEYLTKRIKESMNPAARQPGDCPYGADVCGNDYCAGITDWSRPELVIDSRVECKNAIKKYCEENPKHASCYCWNSEDNRYGNEDCLRWRSFIGAGECKELSNLGDDDIKKIKEKYNLQDIKCEAEEEKKPKTGILNYYEEGGKKLEEDVKKGDKKDDGKPKISNYYKLPGSNDEVERETKKTISNPYTSVGYSIDSSSSESHGSISNPYHDRPSMKEVDRNRLVPMHNLDFHDKWGDKSKNNSSDADAVPTKSIWQKFRSLLTGDD